MIPTLLPFCKMLQKQYGHKVIIMEDNASNHKNPICNAEYLKWMIERFDWPPCSPDMNPIEKAWDWCRRYLRQKNFEANTREELEEGWREAWQALPQEEIDHWFEDMPNLLRKIKEHNGDNDFHS